MFDLAYKDLINKLDQSHIDELNWFNKHKGKILAFTEIKNKKFANNPKGIYCPKGKENILAIKSLIKSRYDGKESKVFKNNSGGWYFEYAPEYNKKGMEFFTNARLLRNGQRKIPFGVIYQVKETPSLYEVLGTALVRYAEDIDMFQVYGFEDDGNIRFL